MGGVDSEPAPQRVRRTRIGTIVDVLLALIAHALVGLAWLGTSFAVMGSLGVLRRIPMNSEFAWDTGRLPQPWAIAVGVVGIVVAHWLFGQAMRRAGHGTAAYGPSVVAWCGALLGVLLGAYLWIPPVQVGVQVGPSAGESTPWGPLGWAAYYSRMALPGVVGLITLVLLVASRQSPLVWAVRELYAHWRGPRARGRRVAA